MAPLPLRSARLLLSVLLATTPLAHAQGGAPSLEEATELALRDGRRLDWTEVFSGDERLVFLGETHPDQKNKRALAEGAPEIAAAGFTHIALEMFGQDRQGFLDDFKAGKPAASASRLAALLRQDWGWAPDSYAAFMEAVRSRFTFVALDMPASERQARIRAACGQTPQAACVAGAREALLGERDDVMAARLRALLSEPGARRVLVLVGALHVGPGTLPQKAGAPAYKSFVFIDDQDPNDITTRYYNALVRRHYRLNPSGGRIERAFLPTPRSRTGYDGFLMIPTTR